MKTPCILLVLTALLCACTSQPARNPLAQWVPSPNQDERRPVIIVIHATEQDSVQRSLDTLRTQNRGGPVSSHYLAGRDGSLYQLVADERRAWHAGGGRWGAITDLNSASIGIELDNNGDADFPPAQIETLIRLLDDLCTRLRIPRHQIIAHHDMAPTRKRDPNARFPWKTLAEAGFGVWPEDDAAPAPDGFDAWLALAAFGYPMDDPQAALRAFQRRFRGIETPLQPDLPWIEPDAQDARILHALTRHLRPAPGM
ncbi:N-acetylmuramoyl-L-alanine amidase [Xanthomonadaceae bacterium XH05]|nr:N-acetylmuramoyl-L-alanine amidase [Xanthomonadaceae bacterium XH05]